MPPKSKSKGKQSKKLASPSKQTLKTNIANPSSKYPCFTCLKDISNNTSILVKDKFYCVGCFAKIEEKPNYHVIQSLNFPIIEKSWSAKEELLLLEGLQKYNFGNWKEIANHLDSDATPEEVERHYLNLYIKTQNSLPVIHSSLTKQAKIEKKNQKSAEKIKQENERQDTSMKKNLKDKEKKSGLEGLGFNQKRQDFELEYDNEAETLISELEFSENDSKSERELKYQILGIYNKRLEERNKKKKFILERNLVFQNPLLDSKEKTKRFKEIQNMARPFARFHKESEHQQLIEGINKQRDIRAQIMDLEEKKKRGARTLKDVELLREKQKGKDDSISREKSKFLRENQKNLCRQLKISEAKYLIVKQTILNESEKVKLLKRKQIVKMFMLNNETVNAIINEMKANNEMAKLQEQ